MQDNLKNIAILEAGGSHDEILYPQFRFLKDDGFTSHLIIRSEHFRRIKTFDLVDNVFTFESEKNWTGRWKNLLSIRNYLLKNNITHLLINTCQGAFIRDLIPLLPGQLNITGISHNPHKLDKSFNQRIINRRVKKYLVLSDNILENVRRLNQDLNLESFYPVFYPITRNSDNNKAFIVTVPGAVDLKRRDYFHLLEELKNHSLDPLIKFVFLGRCKNKPAIEFRNQLASFLNPDQYVFFEDFIPEEHFLEWVSGSDLILPLITPVLENFPLYRDYKITGGINLAYGYQIPLLLHESLKNSPDYKISAFFYTAGRLVEIINHLAKNPAKINEIRKTIGSELKFNYSFQKERYIQFIEKNI